MVARSDDGSDGASTDLTWGVGAVSERLGIAQATLRTWERRYGLGPSQRTAGGHRRYSAHDIERVEFMRRLLARGVSPREAAGAAHDLDSAEVAAMIAGEQPGDAAQSAEETIAAIVSAAVEVDSGRLASLFGGVLRRHGVAEAWEMVLAPSLIRIGEGWSDGTIDVISEHIASERLIAELRLHTRAHATQVAHRGPVLASAEDDLHALPVFALEAALAERGVGCHVLGARVPWDSLADLAQRTEPEVIFVWATVEQHASPTMTDAMSALPDRTRLVLGGPGWGSLATPRATRSTGLIDAVEQLAPAD